jgi:hypothetical protein
LFIEEENTPDQVIQKTEEKKSKRSKRKIFPNATKKEPEIVLLKDQDIQDLNENRNIEKKNMENINNVNSVPTETTVAQEKKEKDPKTTFLPPSINQESPFISEDKQLNSNKDTNKEAFNGVIQNMRKQNSKKTKKSRKREESSNSQDQDLLNNGGIVIVHFGPNKGDDSSDSE